MEYRWIEDIKEYHKIAKEWDKTLLDSGDDNPFLLSDFILTWWRYYYKNKKLMIFCVYDGGGIIAGAPLCISKRYGRTILMYIGGCHANFTHCMLVNPKFNIGDILISSLKKKGKWDIFALDRILFDNSFVAHCEKCRSLSSNGLIYNILDAGFNGRIDLTKGYKNIIENLPKRLRRYLRNMKQKASCMGELKLHKITGSSNIRRLLKEHNELSIKSFKMRGNISAFGDNIYSSFYEELLEILDRKKRLDAHKLTAGKSTLGISFGYRLGKGFKWILTAFNPDFHQLRPGHLLIDALAQEAINNGDPYFDMYYGGEVFYKQQWCNEMKPLKKIQIYRNNILNRLSICAENTLRSSEKFMTLARKARKIIRRCIS